MECEKTSFETRSLALIRLNEIKEINDRETTPSRVYKCKKCDYFHLTSMAKSKFRSNTKKHLKRKAKQFNDFLRRETEYWENKFKD